MPVKPENLEIGKSYTIYYASGGYDRQLRGKLYAIEERPGRDPLYAFVTSKGRTMLPLSYIDKAVRRREKA